MVQLKSKQCQRKAKDEVRKEELEGFPSAKKFRYNGIMPELEEKLDILFDRVVVTGADIWVSNSGVLPPELRDVEELASSEEHQDDEANTLHTDSLDDPIIGAAPVSHPTALEKSAYRRFAGPSRLLDHPLRHKHRDALPPTT
ncbi:hypothetical protein M5K25_005228 [Dendrobium thyrsiflorum]|uniref:Uncharacterized protein n=1 Tax=Dendrobium thyrsiflorum TaxID=117978 RepID=A0ABD0VNR1_DENTH